MGASIMDILANYNPAGFALRNQDAAAQVRQRQAAAALTQQQAQGAGIENQEKAIGLRDSQIWSDALRQTNGDPNGMEKALVQGGISGPGWFAYQKNKAELGAKQALAYKDQQEGRSKAWANEQALNDQKGSVLTYALGLDPAARAQQRPAIAQRLQALDPAHDYGDVADESNLRTQLGLTNYVSKQAEIAKSKAEADRAAADAAHSTQQTQTAQRAQGLQELSAITDDAGYQQWRQKYPAVAAGAPAMYSPQAAAMLTRSAVPADKQPGYDIEQMQAQAMQQYRANPQAGGALIDKILPATLDGSANAAYRAAYDAAMAHGGPKAAEGIISAAAAHAASISNELNPNVRRAKIQDDVSKSVAVARATAPIEMERAITTAKALRQGDNPAVAGVAPAAVAQVQNQAIKLDESYIKAKAATDAMGRLLDLAESGNKAAGSNVPLVGVETLNAINGIKRINSAEISQYGSAGSLLDQLQGKIGKLTQGQPIPPDVLRDIRELHQSLGQQSYQDYSDSIGALNNRTGAKFAPNQPAPNIRKGAAPAAAQGGYQTGHSYAGKVYLGGDPNNRASWK